MINVQVCLFNHHHNVVKHTHTHTTRHTSDWQRKWSHFFFTPANDVDKKFVFSECFCLFASQCAYLLLCGSTSIVRRNIILDLHSILNPQLSFPPWKKKERILLNWAFNLWGEKWWNKILWISSLNQQPTVFTFIRHRGRQDQSLHVVVSAEIWDEFTSIETEQFALPFDDEIARDFHRKLGAINLTKK